MAYQRCVDCRAITTTRRCPTCATTHERARTQAKRTRRPYPTPERKRRANAVTQHRETHGDWCPGWQRPPHPTTDLTADHLDPVGAGGDEGGPLQVLCRSCNSAKGAHAPSRQS